MKTLYIMRHGQKDTSNSTLDDYDVQLTQKGLDDIKITASKLKERNILPDLIVSSPAIRTRQTVEIVAPIIGYDNNIMFNEIIYKAYLNELIESVSYTYDNVNSLMLVGHNPALTALGVTLGGFDKKLLMGEVLKIEFNCDSWIDIDKSNGKLLEHITPNL